MLLLAVLQSMMAMGFDPEYIEVLFKFHKGYKKVRATPCHAKHACFRSASACIRTRLR
jgi:hypothetical protein